MRAGAVLGLAAASIMATLLLSKFLEMTLSHQAIHWLISAVRMLMIASGFALTSILCLLFLAAVIVGLIGPLLVLSATVFGLGVTSMLTAVGLRISVETSPPGAWTTIQLDAANKADSRSYSHETHSDLNAMKAVEQFLRALP
jgi:hypothetical protein